MKRLANRLLTLYPRPWRERYGLEMEALLEELNVGPAVVADLLIGVLLAHTVQLKENLPMKRISPAAIAAVLFVPLIIAAALLLMSTNHMTEPGGEFLILFAPLLIVPLMAPLSAAYPEDGAGLNRATRLLGLGSAAAMAVLAFLSVGISIIASPVTPVPLFTALFLAAASGLALWFVLNGWLALRGGKMPAVLGLLGILVGVLSLIIFWKVNSLVQAALSQTAYTSVMSIVTPLWLVCLPVWALWSAGWLWSRREKSPGETLVGNA